MFSVIVPLYNKGQTIVETLQSVLAQDFSDFEVIIVDDGSTDDGPEKIEKFFNDPRIRMIRQENSGEGAARNAGIDAARYDLVAPLDADDLWTPGYLTEVSKAVRSFPNAGMFCCGGIGRNPDGSGIIRKSKIYDSDPQKVNFFKAPAFFGNASSIVFSKNLVPVAGAFPVAMRQHADIVFFFRLALVTEVVFCPGILSIYNLGLPGQVSSDRRANSAGVVESSNLIFKFWDSLDPAQKDPNCIRAVVNNLRDNFRYPLANSDYELIAYFFEGTDARLLQRLTSAERTLYPRPQFRRAALVLNRLLSGLPRRISRTPSPRFSVNVVGDIGAA